MTRKETRNGDRRTDLRTLDEHAGRFEVYDALGAVAGQSHGLTRDTRETPHAPCDDEGDRDDREDTRDENHDETPLLVPDGGQTPDAEHMKVVNVDDLDLEGHRDEIVYPTTATVTEWVQYVPPEYAEYGAVYFVPTGARLVGKAFPLGCFPDDTFDDGRNDYMVDHGDVVRLVYAGDGDHHRVRAFHPRVTDAPENLVVAAETENDPNPDEEEIEPPEWFTDGLEEEGIDASVTVKEVISE